MKRLIAQAAAAAAALAFAGAALAADVTATVTVKRGDAVVFSQTNTFAGLTDEQARQLQATGQAQLDLAAKHQDKGGPYTMLWKWGDLPEIETPGMKFSAVNQVLRAGVRWLEQRVIRAEDKARRGIDKPWGPGT